MKRPFELFFLIFLHLILCLHALVGGIILFIWITIQMMVISYFWLQPLLLVIGLLIIIFTLMPRIQKYYSLHP